MSIFSRALDFFGLVDEGFEVEGGPQLATAELSAATAAPKVQRPVEKPVKQTKAPEAVVSQPVEEKKVVAMRTQPARPARGSQQPMSANNSGKITILEPRSYNEVQSIAKHILNGEAVLINFQEMEEEQARRIVDFLTGTVYAQDGDIKRVGDEIFLCTPEHFEVNGTDDDYHAGDAFEV